jgi:hypothetical protein
MNYLAASYKASKSHFESAGHAGGEIFNTRKRFLIVSPPADSIGMTDVCPRCKHRGILSIKDDLRTVKV